MIINRNKILFLGILLGIVTNCFAEQLMYKCKGNKSFAYYKGMNQKGNYNGWYPINSLDCNKNLSTINVSCNDAGTLVVLDVDGNSTPYTVSGVNCSNFNLNFPQTNFVI